MLQRIRKCFEHENQHKLFNTVEVDETYIGGKERNKNIKPNKKGTQGRSTKSKIPVIGMIERKGKIVSHIIENTKSEMIAELAGFIRNNGSVTKDKIVLTTENKKTVERIKTFIKTVYNVDLKIETKDNTNFSKKELVVMNITTNISNVLKIIDSAGKNDTGQDRMGNDKICTVRALR